MLLTAASATVTGCSDRRTPAETLLNAAVDAARAGDWDKTFNSAVQVLKRDSGQPDALVLHAIAAEKLGRTDLALNSARKAAELHPGYYAAQYTLGRMLADRPGAAAEAILPLERALKARPRDMNTLILLGRVSGRINADNTIDYYRMLPAATQARPEIQNQIAIYYLARRAADPRNLNRALQALSSAYKSDPDNPEIVHNLALFLDHYYPRDKLKAARFYRRYLTLTRHNPELNPDRARARARMRELAPGMRELDQ